MTMTTGTQTPETTAVEGYVVGNVYTAGAVVDWTGPTVPRLSCAQNVAERRSYPVRPLRLVEVTEPLSCALGYLVAQKTSTPQRPEPHLRLKWWGLVLATFERAVPRGPEAVVVAVVNA